MPSRELSFPVFAADSHFRELGEALTESPSVHREGVAGYGRVGNRTEIAIRNESILEAA
ncbi:hypothetical protein [Nocardia noduli]|uniref:hypothetical protein n=1 Tax=Nocardia noduli TaxID=2815722 RepID=UPI001C235AE0|nr:hypothetical protein [Nocardia noduli]